MGRAPCCSKVGLHRGPWTPTEDSLLANYIQTHGKGRWRSLLNNAGLLRCGKSCRLRWMNYLRPDIKRGNITPDEEDLVIRLHALLGNRWSLIAGRLPGRTDNEIKNYWNTHLSKRLRSQGTDPNTHKKLSLTPPEPKPKRKRTPPASNTNKISKQTKGKANGRAAAERPKAMLHQPKPVRLTSLPLSVNNSNASFKSSLTSVSASISNGSCGGVPVAPPYDQFGRYGGMTSSMMMMMINDHEGGGGGPGFTVGSSTAKEEDDVAGLVVQEHPPAASDQNTLDRLYDEYLQLIKADDGHGHGLDLGPDPDGYKARELDSFVESLLI